MLLLCFVFWCAYLYLWLIFWKVHSIMNRLWKIYHNLFLCKMKKEHTSFSFSLTPTRCITLILWPVIIFMLPMLHFKINYKNWRSNELMQLVIAQAVGLYHMASKFSSATVHLAFSVVDIFLNFSVPSSPLM